ncbi:rhomboid family intramembrane serine protease [Massilia sp. TS11]|uniref:rhomboid family intramembrane serine protease n=1 Tax=Massilia sp. TS11 TaxID=2908003 RepID=UPI001EDA24AC|nr:rhomboid family intramembrane serine protease [Massilia sp. TS11]MCG2584803.1 rhomboid family intramembrane serine protease [Massilia sp. TS11]
MHTFPVTFFLASPSTEPDNPPNPFRWYGAGSVSVEDGSLLLQGRRHRMFRAGEAETQRIALARVKNLRVSGAAVCFELEGSPDQTLGFQAADALAAQSLCALLPTRWDAAAEAAFDEQQSLAAALAARAPVARVSRGLMGALLAVYALSVVVSGALEPDNTALLTLGAQQGDLVAQGQWWRLISATFLHAGLLHLVMNVSSLNAIGPLTERLLGSARFALVYAAAGLAGGLASLWFHPQALCVGASGAIFGILGVSAVAMLTPRYGLSERFRQEGRRGMLGVLGINLLISMALPFVNGAAHGFGFATGLVLGWLLAQPLTPARASA